MAESGAGTKFQGRDEGGWLDKQIAELFNLRNALLVADHVIDHRRDAIHQLITEGERRLKNYEKRVRRAEKQLKADAKTPKGWKDTDPGKDNIKTWNKLSDNKRMDLMHSYLKHGGRLPGDRLFLEDGSLVDQKSAPKKFPNLPGLKAALTGLKGTIVPDLKSQSKFLKDSRNAVIDELDTVQGPGISHKPMKNIPAFGVLGGEIFDVQYSKRQIDPAYNGGATSSEQIEDYQTLLNQANARLAVSQSNFDVLSATPVLGAFAEGTPRVGMSGAYIVGEKGPEIVDLDAGASVTSNADIASMLSGGDDPGIKLIVNGDVITEAKDPFEVVVGDRRFKPAVEKATRGIGRRANYSLPSRGGGFNG